MILRKIKKIANENQYSFVLLLGSWIYSFLRGNKSLIAAQNVIIKNIKNIKSDGLLLIAVSYNGFTCKKDLTVLNIRGKLIVKGDYSIGRGCRIDVGPKGLIEIGKGGYVNSFTNFIISQKLKIGDGCAISWNCQFLDEDFHDIQYEAKKTN
ncbi:MAG TPA: hypothetical protein GXZ87_11225 [Bacteroidales bacterium]|nr:hypothetical protein [Bacteroidales bacterium]